ncbi:hypothetical protein Sjap_013896 [Stephania japonica]|uniref:Uncharacterized protein n=1 Tax=Stephania japonica TaxID=461633 RepID=A0AAP0IYQ8_9MAGN
MCAVALIAYTPFPLPGRSNMSGPKSKSGEKKIAAATTTTTTTTTTTNNNNKINRKDANTEAPEVVLIVSSSSDELEEGPKSSNNSNDETLDDDHHHHQRKYRNSVSNNGVGGSCCFPANRIRKIIRSEGADFRTTQETMFLINKATVGTSLDSFLLPFILFLYPFLHSLGFVVEQIRVIVVHLVFLGLILISSCHVHYSNPSRLLVLDLCLFGGVVELIPRILRRRPIW